MTPDPTLSAQRLRRSSRLLGDHFHLRRFLHALLIGVVATTLLSLSGLTELPERLFLAVRLQIRPNFVQPDAHVRVALLGSREEISDRDRDRSAAELIRGLRESPRKNPVLLALTFSPDRPSAGDTPSASWIDWPDAGAADSPPTTLIPIRFVDSSSEAAPDIPSPGGFPLPPRAERIPEARAFSGSITSTWSRLGLPPAFSNVGVPRETAWEIHETTLLYRYRGRIYPSIGLAAAMAFLRVPPEGIHIVPGRSIRLEPPGQEPIEIPIDMEGRALLNIRPSLGRLPHGGWLSAIHRGLPYEQLVSTAPPSRLLESDFLDAPLVFVGDPRQRVNTPISTGIPEANIHAQVTNDIVTRDFLRRLPLGLDFLAALACVGLFAFCVARWEPQGIGAVGFAILIGLAHGAFSLFLLGAFSLWMNEALVFMTMLALVPADAYFLHFELNRLLTLARQSLDQLEANRMKHATLVGSEEEELSRRLEMLRRQELLARSILARHEELAAKVIPGQAESETSNGAPPPSPIPAPGSFEHASSVHVEHAEPRREDIHPDASPASAPPALSPVHSAQGDSTGTAAESAFLDAGRFSGGMRQLFDRYRGQMASYDALIHRYRILMDRMLEELEARRVEGSAPLAELLEKPEAEALIESTGLVTRDPKMLEILEQIVTRIGPNERATVLVSGESGTGKELAARAIHRNSPRQKGPFVALNCAAFPEGLIESELFGHVKGAFSGATQDRRGAFLAAEHGTLFLDEIGDMPLSVQAKLLRALQERSIRPVGADRDVAVDVRIVAATHRDLRRQIEEGGFREDLFHRLHVIPLLVPPLRERKEDIPLLARIFLEQESRGGLGRELTFSEHALDRLMNYSWPGNVRELQNAVIALSTMASGPVITSADVNKLLEARQGRQGPMSERGFSDADLKWLKIFREETFSIVRTVARPEAPAHNRQSGYRRLFGLTCKALYLADFSSDHAARLLAGGDDPSLLRKAKAKIRTYVQSIRQAGERHPPERFEREWRRFLGKDVFYIVAVRDAINAGRLKTEE